MSQIIVIPNKLSNSRAKKLDEVMGVRTRAIERNLKSIEVHEIESNTKLIDDNQSA